jgi:hypothetical protein
LADVRNNPEHAPDNIAEDAHENCISECTHEVAADDGDTVFEPIDSTEIVDDDRLAIGLDEEPPEEGNDSFSLFRTALQIRGLLDTYK